MENLNKNREIIRKREPVQLELFSQMTSKDLYSNLAKNNRLKQVKLKKPVEIDPVDCDVW